MNELVSIIIVNYNGLSFLKRSIPTIKNQSYKNIEILLVDNNSSDETIPFFKKNYPEIKIIRNKINFGFAKGNNLGAKKARGKFLFFLNNDTELFSNTVEKLMNAYQPKSILSGFQISWRDRKSRGHAGDCMDIFGYSCHDDNISKAKIFYADGVAMFLKKSDFFRLGMFDEMLFMFQEDVDLSWRAQIFGYKIVPCNDAKLYHYYGGTASLNVSKSNKYITSYFRRYLNEKNVIRNILKNYSLPVLAIVLSLLFIFHFFEMLIFILTGKFKAVKCYLQAYWWNVKHIRNTFRIREKVQRDRISSDWELMKKMNWQYTKLKLFLKMGLPEFK